MATTKVVTAIWNSQNLAADSTQTSSSVNLDDGYGAALHVKVTNGNTGPSVPAYTQIQVSADGSEWYDFGERLIAGTGDNETSSWGGIDIPQGVEYLRLVATGNKGQPVTLDADISEVTAV